MVNEWLGNNDLSCAIFNKKYRYNEESVEEFFDRVSNGNKSLATLIKEKKFIFLENGDSGLKFNN